MAEVGLLTRGQRAELFETEVVDLNSSMRW